jgi:hypothetical protein
MKNTKANKVEATNEVMPTVEVINEQVKPVVKKNYKPRKKHNKNKQEQPKIVVLAVEDVAIPENAILDVFTSEDITPTKKEKFKFLNWLRKTFKW